jgi:hypothetical protein
MSLYSNSSRGIQSLSILPMPGIPTEFAVPTVPGLHEFLAAESLGDYEAGHGHPGRLDPSLPFAKLF